MFLQILLFAIAALGAGVSADHDEQFIDTSDLDAVVARYWVWAEDTFPGATGHSLTKRGRMFNYTEDSFTQSYVAASRILDSLKQIKEDDLSESDRLNYQVLNEMLERYTDGYRFRKYTAYNAMNFMENPIASAKMTFSGRPGFATVQDLKDYASEYLSEDLPTSIRQQMALMEQAIADRTTLYNETIAPMLRQCDEYLAAPIEDNIFYSIVKTTLGELPDNSTQEVTDAVNAVKSAIENSINPAIREVRDFLFHKYLPATRAEPGISSLEGGRAAYDSCIKFHLGEQDMTAEEIHELGKREVDRIAAEMNKIIKAHDFNGTIPEFLAQRLNDQKYYYSTVDELLAGYTDIVEKRIAPLLPSVFSTITNIPVRVVPLYNEGPSGFYGVPTEQDPTGKFYVNVVYPQKMPKFNMVALTLHEADPGHHLQHALVYESKNLPAFRQTTFLPAFFMVPFGIPNFSSYVEGWALYAEYLGEEMGVYRADDFELLGRYGYEIWRACRLVVDTGMHAKGWSRQRAIDFMKTYSTEPDEQVIEEVDRYIAWPGQALAYKLGELQIKEMRANATSILGENFNVKSFHAKILSLGAVPMRIVEQEVNKWVRAEQERVRAQNGALTIHYNLVFNLVITVLALTYHRVLQSVLFHF